MSKTRVIMTLLEASIYCGLSFFVTLIAKSSVAYADIKIATYNVENFWDNEPDNSDAYDEFFPALSNWYSSGMAKIKAKQIAKVLQAMDSPDIVAFQELESGGDKSKSLDLLKTEMLNQGYTYFSLGKQNDRRVSVTTAFVSKLPFKTESSVKFKGGASARDPQIVEVEINGVTLRIYNNHWKSKRGKENDSKNARLEISSLVKSDIDQTLQKSPQTKVIVVGDLNSEAFDNEVTQLGMLDLWNDLDKSQRGSHFFNKEWATLDHILISKNLLGDNKLSYGSGSFAVVGKNADQKTQFLMNGDGKPLRWQVEKPSKRRYEHKGVGFSDHLPLICTLDTNAKKPAEKLKSNASTNPEDYRNKLEPTNCNNQVCVTINVSLRGLEKHIFSAKENAEDVNLTVPQENPIKKSIYKELKKSLKNKTRVSVKGIKGWQDGRPIIFVMDVKPQLSLKTLIKL